MFAHQGNRFKRIDNVIYGQASEEESLICTVAVIKAYEDYALKISEKKGEKIS